MSTISAENLNKLTELPVDEIFQRYSVNAIRALHKEYNANVLKARKDLHSLVGEKYRDLIRIAEDIDTMSETSKLIDDRITHLAYKPADHVPFERNNHTNFDRIIRQKNAAIARSASRSAILNNIINHKLLAFDLKMKKNAVPQSSCLVHIAKIYYTIDVVFDLETNHSPLNVETFTTLRAKFIDYLELKLASSYPNKSLKDLLSKALFVDSKSQWLEANSIEFFVEMMEEEEEEINEDNELLSDMPNFYDSSSSPIVNYLVAYIIVNSGDHHLNTLEKVTNRLIRLRCEYLTTLIDQQTPTSPQKAGNLSFSLVLSAVQTTLTQIEDSTFESGSNEVETMLHRAPSWKASDFVGFHNWFENEQVTLNVENFKSLGPNDIYSIKKESLIFTDLLYNKFVEIVTEPKTTDPIARARRALSVFYNFVTALRKSEVISTSSTDISITSIFSESNLAKRLFDVVIAMIDSFFNELESTLTNKITCQLDSDISENSNLQSSNTNLFNSKILELMEKDTEGYLEKIIELSSGDLTDNKDHIDDAAGSLSRWFRVEKELSYLVSMSESEILRDLFAVLNRSYKDITSFESWGDFSIPTCKTALQKLNDRKSLSLSNAIAKFVTHMISSRKRMSHNNDIKKLHYVLHLCNLIKSNSSSFYESEEINSALDLELSSIFHELLTALEETQDITSNVPSISMLSEFRTTKQVFDTGVVPVRPHLIITSVMQQLSDSILHSDYLNTDELYQIFLNENSKNLFVSAKNKWIKNTIIGKYLVENIQKTLMNESASVKTEETNEKDLSIVENEEVNDPAIEFLSKSGVTTNDPNADSFNSKKLQASQSRQLVANIAYLLCFTCREPLEQSDKELNHFLKKISEFSETEVEEPIIEAIIRGINDSFKVCKDSYLLLSAN